MRAGTHDRELPPDSLRNSGCEFEIAPGDGAFYGPSVHLRRIGRQVMAMRFIGGLPLLGKPSAGKSGGDGAAWPVSFYRAVRVHTGRFMGI